MKTTNKKNQKPADSYKAEILKKSGIVTNQGGQAYVRPEFHRRMEEIISLCAEKDMTVEDYLDHVLTEHFAQFQNEIDTSLERHTKRSQYREGGKSTVRAAQGERNAAYSERLLAAFLEPSEIKTRQCVYIDRETHKRVANITRFLGEGLSIGKFVDNVLRDHLRKHKALYTQALQNINPVEL